MNSPRKDKFHILLSLIKMVWVLIKISVSSSLLNIPLSVNIHMEETIFTLFIQANGFLCSSKLILTLPVPTPCPSPAHALSLSVPVSVSLSCSPPLESLSLLLCPWNSRSKNTGAGSHFFSRGSFQPRDQTQVSCIAGRFFTF